MQNKFIKIILFLLVIIFIVAFINLCIYYNYQRENIRLQQHYCNDCFVVGNHNQNDDSVFEFCRENKPCFRRLSELLLPELLLYNAYIDGKPLKLVQFDGASTYKVVLQAIEKSDALIGYGIGWTCDFEDIFKEMYSKPVYAFDCGVSEKDNPCKKCSFESECIATDKYIVKGQTSSEKIHLFGDKLKELNLENKKIYLKMDIAGAEKEVMPDILRYSDNITAISIVLHITTSKEIMESLELLKALNKDFVLVSRSNISHNKGDKTDKYMKYIDGMDVYYVTVLSYVNKNIVDKYSLKLMQTSKSGYIDLMKNKYNSIDYEPYSAIRWQVSAFEFLKKYLHISYE